LSVRTVSLRPTIRQCLAFVGVLLGGFPAAASPDADLATARELFSARRYPEALPLLEKIVTADPNNAAAHHYLGRTLAARNDNASFAAALPHLARAAELDPANAVYQGIYGGTSLQYAGRTQAVTAALRGRDAMLKAIELDPDYLDAREGLFQFYQRAPWPLGSQAKAEAQLAEIRRRNPDLATVLSVTSRINARDYPGAFAVCDEVLAKRPDHYAALYYYGRCASVSGQNLERGLASLQRCLQLEPPSPASPSHSNVWHRIGTIHAQQGRAAEARAAFTEALRLDPSNQQATTALAQLP
jgi:cytochrome c-type biogenesis protein CcmH/NrfG